MHQRARRARAWRAIRRRPAGAEGGPQTGISDLIGAGNLTVTLETDDGAQRYQGIVPISGERLADSLQVYFENSEQLPTRLWLYADGHGASGMLLQRLPGAARHARGRCGGRRRRLAARAAHRRYADAARSCARSRMREILHRLFNEDDLRLFEPSPVYFRCRCSRERVAGMLQGLGEAETRAVLAERGEVEVRCDFCNRAYVFDAVDVGRMFNAGARVTAAARYTESRCGAGDRAPRS